MKPNYPPLGRARVHDDMKRLPLAIVNTFPSDAIKTAFDRACDVYAADQSFENLALCVNLWEIIEQQGCPDGDGSLLNYLDIIIRG